MDVIGNQNKYLFMLDWSKDLKNFYLLLDKNIDYLSNIWSKEPSVINTSGEYDETCLDQLRLDHLKSKHNLQGVKYKLDKNHFRIYNSLNSEKNIFCYGCSNTFGEGLLDNETWPFLLGEHLKINPLNYGIRGATNQKITWIVYNTLNKAAKNNFLPEYFFILFPDMFRFTSFDEDENGYVKYRENFLSYKENIYDNFYLEFLDFLSKPFIQVIKSKEKRILNFAQNSILEYFMSFVMSFKFIDSLASMYNIKWYWSSWDPIIIKINDNVLHKLLGPNTFISSNNRDLHLRMNKDTARDNAHIGPYYSQFIANSFYELTK